MSENSSSHFPRLNDTNYVKWAMRMEAELIRRNLWAMVKVVVDEDGKDADIIQAEWMAKKNKQSMQKMAEARSELIL